MTHSEFLVELKKLVRQFEAEGPKEDDPETFAAWLDYFTGWLP